MILKRLSSALVALALVFAGLVPAEAASPRTQPGLLSPAGGGIGGNIGSHGWFFASQNLRQAVSTNAIVSGKEYNQSVWEDVSPPYVTNDFIYGFADHWAQQATANAETAINGPITILAFSLSASFDSQTWTPVRATFGTALTGTVDPSLTGKGGIVTDPIHFAQNVPPNTRLQLRLDYTAAVGTQIPNHSFTNRHLTDLYTTPAVVQGTYGAPTDIFSAGITNPTPVTSGTGLTTASGAYRPVWAVAKAVNGLDRPALWGVGDSMFAGSNMDTQEYCDPRSGAAPAHQMAFDDSTRSRRTIMQNYGRSGTSPDDWVGRTKVARGLDLLRQLPNRPYTAIISEHYTNAQATSTQALFRTMMQGYYATLNAESTFWGDPRALIYQSRPIPKSSSTDLWTTLANQTADTTAQNRWPFDADLLAGFYTDVTGLIPFAKDLQHDQGANSTKWKALPFSTTTTAATLSTDTTITLADPVSRGDSLALNPGGTGQVIRDVKSVSNGGTTVLISLPTGTAFPSNIVVKKTLTSDSVSHPDGLGHLTAVPGLIDWKLGTFGP